ncbi:MAG TPA: hypothetical protein VK858_03385 [Longimicrobiales bacterium]|nr:hypothetical protein [Longimicrobiales bacterium]
MLPPREAPVSHRPFTLKFLAAVLFLPACDGGGSPERAAVERYDSAGIPIVVSDVSGLPGCTLSPEPRVEIGNRHEPGPALWFRFEPTGEAGCRLDVPDGVDVYEFGPDYMLGETTDEMGVESVVLYALGKARQASP